MVLSLVIECELAKDVSSKWEVLHRKWMHKPSDPLGEAVDMQKESAKQ